MAVSSCSAKQIHLKIQMRPSIRKLRHAILRDQHETGEQDGFERHQQCEQAERIGIERPAEQAVQPNPHGKPAHMDNDESRAAGGRGYDVCEAFQCRPLSLGFAFEVDDWSVSCPAELRAANLTGAEV
jgi:hypothetical protein